MIYIVMGTRAQLVKMAPIIKEIEQQNWPLALIHTGQHKESFNELISDFQLKTDWHWIYNNDQEVKTILHALRWLLFLITAIFFKPKSLLPDLNLSINNIIIVHGDTFSTVLGAWLGRRLGIKVAHIESGLRSFKIFNPFPEELNRLITFNLINFAFCPNEWAKDNLKKYKNITKINTKNNTLLDSLKIALASYAKNDYSIPSKEYGVISIHRFENIFFSSRLNKIINQLIELANDHYIIFVLHPSTYKRLIKTGFINLLKDNKNIELRKRTGYFNFVNLLAHSQFVITDGGSNQEELSYLNIPTLLMRTVTERNEGLGKNIKIGNISSAALKNFIIEIKAYQNKSETLPQDSPSKLICNYLIPFL